MEVGSPVFKGIYYIRMRWRLTFLSLSSTMRDGYSKDGSVVFAIWRPATVEYDPDGTTRPVGTATGCSSCKVKIAWNCG